MGADTKIEWCDHTFNPWRGCTKVSAGCANCYAERQSKRNPKVLGTWGPKGVRVGASERAWAEVLQWNAAAKEAGRRARVFCASMADVFEDREELNPLRIRLWSYIIATPWLDWLLLTKRPENIDRMLRRICHPKTLESAASYLALGKAKNVWLGVSVEDQAAADERIPKLLAAPHGWMAGQCRVKRFLSCEPLLGPVDLAAAVIKRPLGAPQPDWVIAGGESGPRARPCHPDWARSLRDQCVAAGTAFFWKQWGDWAPWHDAPVPGEEGGGPPTDQDARAKAMDPDGIPPSFHARRRAGREIDVFSNGSDGVMATMRRVGKDRAGRLLDGREWNEFPKDGRE